jgi:putative RNA 2'-phosphotransferase
MLPRAVQISKFLSLVLRHKPQKLGLTLDQAGWMSVIELLRACQQHGFALTRTELESVVALNDKQRFSFNGDKTRIRANQGHSIEVELGYQPVILTVNSGQMHQDGHLFYLSANDVWLTDHVPATYIRPPTTDG